jgi:hypothetical protein
LNKLARQPVNSSTVQQLNNSTIQHSKLKIAGAPANSYLIHPTSYLFRIFAGNKGYEDNE